MISFTCEERFIHDGTFKIEHLKTFSRETGAVIKIPGYGIIKNGEFNAESKNNLN